MPLLRAIVWSLLWGDGRPLTEWSSRTDITTVRRRGRLSDHEKGAIRAGGPV